MTGFQFFFGNLPFARSPIANGVDQCEDLVQIGILQCSLRDRFIERRERVPPGLPVRGRPNRRGFLACGNAAFQWFGCVACGNASRELTSFRRKGILQAVNQELFER
jgi:hypothetical protein